MNSRRLSPTHRLPLHAAERYVPRGGWNIFRGDGTTAKGFRSIKIDPRLNSPGISKLMKWFWDMELKRRDRLASAAAEYDSRISSLLVERLRKHRDASRYFEELIPLGFARRLLDEGVPDLPEDSAKFAAQMAVLNTMHLSSYELMLVGSTSASIMCDLFTPILSLSGVFTPEEVNRLRELNAPFFSLRVSFTEPPEKFLPYEIASERGIGVRGDHYAPLDEEGRLEDYPTLTGIQLFSGQRKVVFASQEILGKAAVPKVREDETEGIAYVYDFDDGMRIVKLEKVD